MTSSRGGLSSLIMLGLPILFINFCPVEMQNEGETAWNTADYYKREHSLGRPYQGEKH